MEELFITENKISNVKSVYATSNTLDLADGITGIKLLVLMLFNQ